MTPLEHLDRLRLTRSQNLGMRMADGFGARDVGVVRGLFAIRDSLGGLGGQAVNQTPTASQIAALKAQLAEIDRHIARQKVEAAGLESRVGDDPTTPQRRSLRQRMGDRLRAAGFGISKSARTLELGPVEIGRAGVQLNRRFMNSAAGGAFKVGMVGHIGVGLGNIAADIKDKIDGGQTAADIAKAVPSAVAEFLYRTVGITGGVGVVGRLAGRDPQDVEQGVSDFFAALRGEDPEGDRRKLARTAYNKTLKSIDEVMRKKWASVEHWTPSDFTIDRNGPDTMAQFRAELRKENEDRFFHERQIMERKAFGTYQDIRDGGGD